MRFENTEADGLGEPLPSGVVRVFEAYGGRDVFAGEAEVGDRPVGLPVELVIGRALNVMLEITTDWDYGERAATGIASSSRRSTASSTTRRVPIELEIRHGVEDYYTDVEVEQQLAADAPQVRRSRVALRVPPGEELLRYQLSALELE